MSGVDAAEGIAARLARLGARLVELKLDALLVDAPFDLRYISGYTGTNGLAVLRPAGGAPPAFLTDFRYTAQAAAEVPAEFEHATVTGELRDSLPAVLGENGGRVGFDETKLTVHGHRRLSELLVPPWELVPANGLVEEQRVVKEPAEVAAIAAACALADEALREVLEAGLVGRTEREVALDLETRMRRLGAEEPSFPSIVAAAEHGALPHAQPREVEIPPDVLVTIDWGARLQGYCSDCTRTVATGDGLSTQAREIYELVLAAQIAGLQALRAGPNGREVDAVARGVIDAAGRGAEFGHGLGHGVGLEIHEAPRLSRTAPEQPLLAGNVVSVEPGVYVPDELGVRIEDLAVVREGGCDVLTALPKGLTIIG
ncbi:MAG TPA: Xaa-Pro peptidase family protein [Solirubrobacteraceae bacterium]|nr:Xaa-Pro peptidase family protein [Solirubrobacteraceae bacterium]